MSAIAGILNNKEEPASTKHLEDMMLALRRYHADYASTWYGGSVSLGCHAQWITPESREERLPHYDASRKLAITADAIIDNRSEVMDRLQVDHSTRRHISDSQLILLAYEKWDKETPKYLIGDFAFVIWDEDNELLFGARDLLGNRSLFYHQRQESFSFCSVIFPLFTLPNVKKELHEGWLAEFLAIPTLQDSADIHSTAYRNIHQLPPASTIVVDRGRVQVNCYGQIAPPGESLLLNSNGEYEEAFRDVFQQAVYARLRTFRQVGATLSGGLDSGSVVSFAARSLRQKGKQLHTYSYIPPADFVEWTGKSAIANESAYIKETVRHTGHIHGSYLDFADRNSFTDIDEWLGLMEAPYKIFENSFWIRGIFEQASRSDIGILLTGARGNHTISWGPVWGYYTSLARRMRWIRLYREVKQYSKQIGHRRAPLLRMLAKSAFPLLDRSSRSGHESQIPILIHPDFAQSTKVFERLERHNLGTGESMPAGFDNRRAHLDNQAISSMHGVSGTKLSLQYKAWERDPTSDPRVIRFCLSVPIEQYVQNGVGRSLVRRATAGYLPDKVRLNQQIRGIQGADWVHRMKRDWHTFREEIRMLCRDSNASQYLNVHQIRQSLSRIADSAKPEYAFDADARFLMRSVIAYRFIKQFG